MTTQVQFRRGTTAEHSAFTGAIGEVTVDTTLDTIRVHDGATAGGVRIAKFSEIPSSFDLSVEADDSAGITITADGTDTLRFAGGTNINTSTDSAGTVIIATNSDLTVNTLSSSDSTAITINDDINLAGVLRSEDSGTVSVDGAMSISGAVTSAGGFVGDGASISNVTAAGVDANSVALGTDTTGSYVQQGATSGNGISGSVNSEGGTFTVTSNATNANTGSTIVFRDGSGNFSAGTITAALTGNVTGDVTGNADTATEATNVTVTANNSENASLYITFVDGASGTQGIETDTSLRYNPSTNVLSTTASQAQYADLAEKYTADATYDVGHVMVHGGTHEITQSTVENDTKIAGVVSEKWAYLMNQQEDGPAIALKGKVECKVVGSVSKGDLLVTSNTPGHAVASSTPNPFAVIGRSLVDDDQTHPRTIFIKI